MSDKLIERPPIIVYDVDLNRLRSFGVANGCGDSAVALRKLLDLYDGIAELGEEAIVRYWRETYHRRTHEAHKLRGALIAIAAQLDALNELPWWRWRRRRRHELAIADTLRLVAR